MDKAKAADRINLGLRYRFLGPGKFRIQCVHDASSASKGRCYAQEGVLVMLMPELPNHILNQDEISCSDSDTKAICNYARSRSVRARWQGEEGILQHLTRRDIGGYFWHGGIEHDGYSAH